MIQERLKTLRKQKGMSQEKMAKILSTDTSNYSRKERGETRIHDEEWQKIADALEVPVEDIKEEKFSGIVHNDNSTFNDHSGNYYNQYFNTPDSIVENLQDYIILLKKEIESLKQELKNK
ncbi:helix-turn-helix transcriptional regulator [Chryseobacterium sp. CFS15]|uniref:helix-turn-helix domain-containing protein n=1 Tax=Chryseobacterium sp. CFS15 TaxID=2986946 RepID=UPI0028083146|nr:helix-turn-helix transcriptional regulator [Chryseobacterium sp. CFS15]MDQ8142636.1 helix-turn-helix transcriptional regulator [Chryseobacterium sp. CFS15]